MVIPQGTQRSRAHPGGVRILDRLRDEGRISAAQYESFYHQAKRSGERVEESILETAAMGEAELMKFVAALYKTRFVSTERLSKADIDRTTLELVPRRVAERLQCVPILHDKRTQTLSVVAIDLEEDVGKQLQVLTGLREVRVFVARPAAVRAAIRRFYGGDPHAFASIGGSALGLDAFERGGSQELSRPASPGGGIELDLGGFGSWDDRTPAPVPLPVAPVAPSAERAPSPPPLDLTPIRMDVTPPTSRGLEWDAYLETLNVLVALLDAGRGELRGHSSLVARISRQVAERLGLPEDDRHAIAIASHLHDVGKASAYHLTLLNVSRFDGHRLQAQRSYAAPARMLESTRLPERAVDILGHLYERFDGQGFPDRQAAKEIPLGARVVALVETYADLTANPKNPYRRTLAPPEAVDVLRQLAGSLFDPMLVDVLRAIVVGADPSAAKGRARTRVLVVDSDREETTLLELRLAEAGHDVVVARDGADVERTLGDARRGEPRFDLVLSEARAGERRRLRAAGHAARGPAHRGRPVRVPHPQGGRRVGRAGLRAGRGGLPGEAGVGGARGGQDRPADRRRGAQAERRPHGPERRPRGQPARHGPARRDPGARERPQDRPAAHPRRHPERRDPLPRGRDRQRHVRSPREAGRRLRDAGAHRRRLRARPQLPPRRARDAGQPRGAPARRDAPHRRGPGVRRGSRPAARPATHPATLQDGDIAPIPRPVRVLVPVLAPCLMAGVLIAGCGGGGLRGDVYRDEEARYRVGTLGGGWQALGVADQNDLAYHHPDLGAIVQVNATCDPDSDIPLTALTNHLLIGFTERDIREQRVVPMDGREALRTHVVARLDGVPRELLFVVMKKNDCVYDFALITPPGSPFSRATPEFESFVAGFSTEVR